MCVRSELYCGFSDLTVIVCTIIFTDLQKKLAAARREEKKQPRPTGKLCLKHLQTGGPFCCQMLTSGRHFSWSIALAQSYTTRSISTPSWFACQPKGGAQDFKWRGWSNGAKSRTQKNPWGFQQNPKKSNIKNNNHASINYTEETLSSAYIPISFSGNNYRWYINENYLYR